MELLSQLPNPPKKILRTVTEYPQFISPDIYNAEHTFILQKNKGQLKQQFLEATINITTGAVPKSILHFGTAICKRIDLMAQVGPIQTLTPQLIESKIALLEGTPLGNKINNGLVDKFELSTAFDYVVTLPLMWFFSDTVSEFFTTTTNDKEQFTVRVMTNDSMASMGLGLGVTSVNSISFKLISRYDQVTPALMTSDKALTDAYDLYQEKTTDLEQGSTSVTFQLLCPYRVFYNHFRIVGNNGYKDYTINSVEIKGPFGVVMDLNHQTNYSLSSTETSEDYTTSFSIPYGSRTAGYDSPDYITFDDTMMPTYATLTFAEILEAGGAKLYCMSEYRTKLITSSGMVHRTG